MARQMLLCVATAAGFGDFPAITPVGKASSSLTSWSRNRSSFWRSPRPVDANPVLIFADCAGTCGGSGRRGFRTDGAGCENEGISWARAVGMRPPQWTTVYCGLSASSPQKDKEIARPSQQTNTTAPAPTLVPVVEPVEGDSRGILHRGIVLGCGRRPPGRLECRPAGQGLMEPRCCPRPRCSLRLSWSSYGGASRRCPGCPRGSSARMGCWSQRCRLQGPTERLGRGGE